MANAPNPFAAPGADTTAPPAACYKLHGTTAIGLATFLGTMISGGVLMALNFHRLGRGQAAILTLIVTTLATGAVMAVGAVLPDAIPGAVFVVPQILAMAHAANSLQGDDLRRHEAAGGAIASKWYAALISLLVIMVLVFAVGVFMLATGALDDV